MELDFDRLFKSMSCALNIVRLHPNIRKDKIWLLEFFIVILLMIPIYCLIVQNIIYYHLRNNDLFQTCKNGVLLLSCQLGFIQIAVLIYHQDSLLSLIKDINKDYEISKSRTPDEQAIIKKYINLGKRVCTQWFIVTALAPMQFIIKSILLQLYYYCMENEYRLIPMYDLIYPAIIEENKNMFSVYLLTYTLFAMYGISTAITYAGYVPLGPIMMLHACSQLEVAKTRIDTLFEELDDNIIKKKLKTIVEHLQYIYRFVDRITAVFNVAYEVTLKLTALILPVILYAFIEGVQKNDISIELVVFMIGSLLITITPCYYSNLLQDKGEDIRIALYFCGWERHYDRSTRKTLLIMIQYALRPTVIKTLFRTLTLDTLTDFFQQSYTIFNLMNAMWN